MARLLAFAHLTRDGYFAEVSWRPTEQVVMNPVALRGGRTSFAGAQ